MSFAASVLALGSIGTAQAGGSGAYDTDAAFKPHWVVGTFLGATETNYGQKATYGLEASYQLNKKVFVGGVGEYLPDAGKGKDAQIYLGTASYLPTDHVRVLVGAGMKVKSGKTTDLFRVGAAYDLHFGDIHVSPTAAVDFFDGQSDVVYGLVLGRVF